MSVDDMMTLFHELDRLGISARVVDGNLHLRPKEKVTPELAAQLRRYKPAVVMATRLLPFDEDQREAWRERVAICAVDGNLSDEAAEAVAFAQLEACGPNPEPKPR